MSSKLQWALTTKRFGYHIYELAKDNLRLLSLAFDPATQTARVDCNETKRAFRIERKGLLKSRIVLMNEYGVNIGEMGHDKTVAKDGYIDMNDERFFYSVNEANNEELLIYKSGSDEPFLCCKIAVEKTEKDPLKKNLSDVYYHLLMALGWFLFLPLGKEKMVYSL